VAGVPPALGKPIHRPTIQSPRRRARSATKKLRKTNLHISIGPNPNQRQPGRPILPINRSPRAAMLLRRQNPRCSRKLRSSHSSPNRARSHLHRRIVPNAFSLSHIAARHHKKPVALFSKPHRRRHRHPALAKSSQRNILLPLDRRWNRTRHTAILNGSPLIGAAPVPVPPPSRRLSSRRPAPLTRCRNGGGSDDEVPCRPP